MVKKFKGFYCLKVLKIEGYDVVCDGRQLKTLNLSGMIFTMLLITSLDI